MCFGAIMFWEVYRYFKHNWIGRYWEDPQFHFHYVGFGWVHPLPTLGPVPGMHVLWGVLGLAALGIAFGALYRVSAAVFAVGFGYSFLLEAAHYLNHFYLVALVATLLVFVPAHRVWSVDARLRGRDPHSPSPAWALWLIRFQVAVLYIGGGIAKMDPDWLRGEPLGTWLAQRHDVPLLGELFVHPWAGVIAAWAGMLFDLGIVFAVWWRRTRFLGLLAALAFHAINSELFAIGIFPFLAFASLLVFCPPDWPRQVVAGLRHRPSTASDYPSTVLPQSRFTGAWLALAALYVAAQVLIPLRHLAMPGREAWTEGGHTFSWHMKLRDKEGRVTFKVVDPSTGDFTLIQPSDELGAWQASDVAGRPELARQYAHHLADILRQGRSRPRVYALSSVSLNGRKPQALIDPKVDLADQGPTWGTPSWVEPLK